jgi:succinylglutamate desuccinylase
MLERKKLDRVLIVGGTHGNEFTGVFLIKKFEQFPHLIRRSSFEAQTLLGNPQAFGASVRYIDQDLNRSFGKQSLQGNVFNYEEQRSKEIAQQFSIAGETPADVIVDLHSTTANMGVTLILDTLDSFRLQLAAYLSSIDPSIKVYYSGNSGRNQDSLRSLSRFGIGIEIGVVPQGVLVAEAFLKTESLVYSILDYLEEYNGKKCPSFSNQLILYRYIETIDYPRNECSEIQAMVHPQLQFRDYKALHPGDPIFLRFDGTEIFYKGTSVVYPVFINEAAYYEKGIAMCITHKEHRKIEVALS